jgi:hypothetical protein
VDSEKQPLPSEDLAEKDLVAAWMAIEQAAQKKKVDVDEDDGEDEKYLPVKCALETY